MYGLGSLVRSSPGKEAKVMVFGSGSPKYYNCLEFYDNSESLITQGGDNT